jgi:16S rRNA C967 or C1407 C5-methylase (RsmB/RsmF family)
LLFDGYAPIMKTPAFAAGQCVIQDEGSQLLSLFALWPEHFAGVLAQSPGPSALPRPAPPHSSGKPASPRAALPRWSRQGWVVVDACAGAGGKALAMADLLGGKGKVFAYDVAAWKLAALRKRAARLGLTNIQVFI